MMNDRSPLGQEVKYTPGPWAVDFSTKSVIGAEGYYIRDEHCVAVAKAFVLVRDETTGNANLMAAAPEMLEALKTANYELAALVKDPTKPDFAHFLDNNNPADAECLEKAFAAIRAAILKATSSPPSGARSA